MTAVMLECGQAHNASVSYSWSRLNRHRSVCCSRRNDYLDGSAYSTGGSAHYSTRRSVCWTQAHEEGLRCVAAWMRSAFG